MVFPILGANTESAAYDISNSVRMGGGNRLSFSATGVTAERKKHTVSAWVKRATLGTEQHIIYSVAGSNYTYLRFHSDDTLRFVIYDGGNNDAELITNAKYRDPSAWYHVVLTYDSAQGTAADRIDLFVNGVEVPSFSTASYPTQNFESIIGNSATHYIADTESGSSWYVADWSYVGDQALGPTSFGEFDDDSGIWKPKKFSSFGSTNDTFLQFKQTGTSANSSGIGADTSGEDNHFAVTNLAATDIATDSPTNNFCTLNPLVNTNFTYEEGNLKVAANPSDNNFAWGTMAGKMDSSSAGWYYEMRLGSAPVGGSGYGLGVGVGEYDYMIGTEGMGTDGGWNMTSDTVKQISTNFSYDADYSLQDNGGSNKVDLNVATSVGHIIQVAWKNSKVFLGVNNTYYAADAGTDGDPANGTNPSHTITSTYEGGNWIPIINSSLDGAELSEFNFGNPSFSISSGNADANGYGNFEYAPPSGFYALCTKNLAEFGG